MWDGGRSVAGNVVADCYACNHARSGVFNQTKRGSKFTIGDDTLSSPFAVLGVLAGNCSQRPPVSFCAGGAGQ
jgi:hypothetical protein